ncbi:MAG: nucleotide exchange factor GrpE [Cyanobacteria bacterium P01_A01_bin.123]
MIDEVNPPENTQASGSEAVEPIEELDVDAADIEIDFDQAFVDSETADSTATEESSEDVASKTSEDSGLDAEGQAALADLQRQVAGLKAQVEDRTGQYVRIAADFENFRKRTSKEKEDMEVQIKCSTISELLPVIDNFERARAQIKPQTESETTIHKSYQSVYKQLVDCLKRIGVSPMRAEGQPFDPMLHEAVMREPTDQHPEDTVMEELVRGYLLGERVLRHAMVKVAAAPEPGNHEQDPPDDISDT